MCYGRAICPAQLQVGNGHRGGLRDSQREVAGPDQDAPCVDGVEWVLVIAAYHCGHAHACVEPSNVYFRFESHSFVQLQIQRTLQSHTTQNLTKRT